MNQYEKKSGTKRQGMMPDGFIRTDDEAGMRQAVRDDPYDDTPRLVFADYLAEQNRVHAEARVRWWTKARRQLLNEATKDDKTTQLKVATWVADAEHQRNAGTQLDEIADPLEVINFELDEVKPEWVKRLFVAETVWQFSTRYDLMEYPSDAARRMIAGRSGNYLPTILRSTTTLAERFASAIKLTDEEKRTPTTPDATHTFINTVCGRLFTHVSGLIKNALLTAEEFALHLASFDELSQAREALSPFLTEFGWGIERGTFIPVRVHAAARCVNKSLHGDIPFQILEELITALARRQKVSEQLAMRTECSSLAIVSIRSMVSTIQKESPTKRLG